MMTTQINNQRPCADRGFSLLETLIVAGLITIVTAFALPQLISARRLQRITALPKQVATQMRLARQEAMSERRAYTFQYNDVNKTITLIAHTGSGGSIITDPSYPNTAGSTVISTYPLTGEGMAVADITYGIPTGLPTGALGDGTTKTTLNGQNIINITFQPDGSVVNGAEQPINFALYFYTGSMSSQTASAISVLGSAGRIKTWRYTSSGNIYAE
ncbi:MAG TPA: prepilin-type N-terminal cleavage/methylation domain-containing protein [Pyrinomonadaceae bacterium]|nr:prepilin-type N-terminal cleavage/methylation domain-containing protein [Pyrinomonadaceae bacterium]